VFVDKNNNAESNPLLVPIIAVSVIAGVMIIVALILLILLLRKGAKLKGLYRSLSL